MLLKYIKRVITVSLFTMLFIIIFAGFTYAEESNTVTATVTAKILNLRGAPNTSAKVIDQLTKGKQMKVIDSSNGWYKLTENGITGWVYGNYVSIINSQNSSIHSGTITGNNVNIRKGPGLSYNVITQLNKGDKLTVLEVSGSWYKTKTSDGTIGWVSSSYILEERVSTDSPESSESEISSRSDSITTDILNYAKSFLGVKYTYGGTTPKTGFDCSGFTKYVFEKFGINLERVASDQAEQGTEVSQNELLPGDLVFSDTDGGNNNISHVGIYIGEGKFINAASGSSSGKVIIADLNSSYWQTTYMTARRVI